MEFRFLLLAASVVWIGAPGGGGAAAAEEYPQRAIRLIIPYPPGGAGDIVGRLLSSRLGESLGQQIVIDNRGTGGHLAVELLSWMAGISLTHVPYKGAAPALVDVIGGQVEIMCTSPLPAMPHVKSGKLRALAMTGSARSRATPEIPTVAEAGYAGYEASLWYALLAPAGTPRAIITRLHAETVKVIRSPAMTEQLHAQGADPVGNSPQELEAYLRAEIDRWTELIARAHIRAD